MTTTSLQVLVAEQQEIVKAQEAWNIKIAALELPLYEKIEDRLKEISGLEVLAEIAKLCEELPDSGLKNSVMNVGAAVAATLGHLAGQIPMLKSRLQPPAVIEGQILPSAPV